MALVSFPSNSSVGGPALPQRAFPAHSWRDALARTARLLSAPHNAISRESGDLLGRCSPASSCTSTVSPPCARHRAPDRARGCSGTSGTRPSPWNVSPSAVSQPAHVSRRFRCSSSTRSSMSLTTWAAIRCAAKSSSISYLECARQYSSNALLDLLGVRDSTATARSCPRGWPAVPHRCPKPDGLEEVLVLVDAVEAHAQKAVLARELADAAEVLVARARAGPLDALVQVVHQVVLADGQQRLVHGQVDGLALPRLLGLVQGRQSAEQAIMSVLK